MNGSNPPNLNSQHAPGGYGGGIKYNDVNSIRRNPPPPPQVLGSRMPPPPPPPPPQLSSNQPLPKAVAVSSPADPELSVAIHATRSTPSLPRRYSTEKLRATEVKQASSTDSIKLETISGALTRDDSSGTAAASLVAALDRDNNQNNVVLKRLSRVLSVRKPSESQILSKPALEPNLAAFRGDLDSLKQSIAKDPLLKSKHFPYYSSSGPLLTPQEDKDRLYSPPPVLAKAIKAALAVNSVLDMSRDQKWLLDHGFADSTLLHYACAGDQVAIVEYLVNDLKVNKTMQNKARKLPEFYTTSDLVRKVLYPVDLNRLLPEKKSTLLSNVFTPLSTTASTSVSKTTQEEVKLEQNVKQRTPLVKSEGVSEPHNDLNTSDKHNSNNRQSRRLSRVLGAKRLSISKMSEASEHSEDLKVASNNIDDNKSIEEGKSTARLSISLQQRPTSQRIKDLLKVVADVKSRKERKSFYRAPVAIRKLSVQGHCLESVMYEVENGGVGKELEHSTEEMKVEMEESTHETIATSSLAIPQQSFITIPTYSYGSSFSSTDSRVVKKKGDKRVPRGERQLGQLSRRDIRKMEEFSKQLCSMRLVANKALQEYSETKYANELINRLMENPKALPSAGAASAISTLSAPPYIPDLENKPVYVEPHKLPFRVMLWRKAGEQLNKGLFDSGDAYLQKRRKQAYEKGLEMFKKEFRSYANKEHWEALDYLQGKTAKVMEEALMKRLREVKAQRRATARATAMRRVTFHPTTLFPQVDNLAEGDENVTQLLNMDDEQLEESYQKQLVEEETLRRKVRKLSTLVVGINHGGSQGYYDIEEELAKLRKWLMETKIFPMDPNDKGPSGKLSQRPEEDLISDIQSVVSGVGEGLDLEEEQVIEVANALTRIIESS